MARVDKAKKLRPSVLDRLLDNDPGNARERDVDQHQKLKQLRNSVRRDLEDMLNTRFRVVEPASEFRELQKSLLNYGLPDLATINIFDKMKRQEFIDHLETLLTEFEPRFKSVKINFMENSNTADKTLRFKIDAVLYADPSPEVVVFDSTLEPVTRTVNVEDTNYG
jgi:type VI secretion system protein ImpF